MAFGEKYLDVLQNIEYPIQVVYKTEKDLTDYDVLSAIEALIEVYSAEERKREPRKFSFSVKSLHVYAGVKGLCDIRLGKGISNAIEIDGSLPVISLNEMLNCLKTIKNSINKWTKRNGRQGYLNFVRTYMPNV